MIKSKLNRRKVTLRSAGRDTLEVLGHYVINFSIQDQIYQLDFAVVKNNIRNTVRQ